MLMLATFPRPDSAAAKADEQRDLDLTGKTAVWKIRVHGPAKFAVRSGLISMIMDRVAYTKEGHALRLDDMVASPDAVIGGGSWAVAMEAPYHATAADRIAATESRLGRKVWAARELPDDLARALWWKQRRWYFDARRNDLTSDDPAIYGADAEFYEAQHQHDMLIRDMWFSRCLARHDALEAKAWAALANIGTAMAEDRVALVAAEHGVG
jgi:hypothetical protein